MKKQYEQRDNNGIVFQNERKTSDSHSDYSGRAMVNGKMMWVSMWRKDGRNGEFFTFSFKEMEERPLSDAMAEKSPMVEKTFKTPEPTGSSSGNDSARDPDDDVPF